MTRQILLYLFLLAATSCSNQAQQQEQIAALQCGKDTDCKGDRICEKNVCISQNTSQAEQSNSVLGVGSGTKLPGTQSKLQKIFRREMIGADVAYFEQVAGIPRQSFGETKIYLVDNCEIVAGVGSKAVFSLSIAISPECSFDLNEFLPSYNFPPLSKLTYGTFDKLTNNLGSYSASCIRGCGNAADPVIYEHWKGSRANGFIDVSLESVKPDLPRWEEAMLKDHSEEWLIMERYYNCTPNKYEPIVREEMRNVMVEVITVGYEIEVEECPSGKR